MCPLSLFTHVHVLNVTRFTSGLHSAGKKYLDLLRLTRIPDSFWLDICVYITRAAAPLPVSGNLKLEWIFSAHWQILGQIAMC